MSQRTRRQFLSEVTQGMLVAAVGLEAASNLELAPVFAAGDDGEKKLAFGRLEPLVQFLQETGPDAMVPEIVGRLKNGTKLEDVVAAAALANARTFGGEDYIGFHTMMALVPSYQMALALPEERRALPVLKVLYRNCSRLQAHGGPSSEILHPVAVQNGSSQIADGASLKEAVRRKDLQGAEQIFARIAQGSANDLFNELMVAVEDESEVHRIVMPYRARHLVDFVGAEHAHTLLRQSVHYCVKNESEQYRESCKGGRDVLPKLIEEYKLLEQRNANRTADDAFVSSLSEKIFRSKPDDAAAAVASAIAEGYPSDGIGEAMSLAANQLVLRDVGRVGKQAQPNKPLGSVHGDSIGVHASDSANAWRNMVRFANARNQVACLILGAYQVARDRDQRGGDFLNWQPYPTEEQLAKLEVNTPDELLRTVDAAVRENDQARAAAAARRFGEQGGDYQALQALLLGHAIHQDGALHAEKYYQTTCDDFATTRPSLRWHHMVGLARVTASGFGYDAPGVSQAEEILAG